MESRVVSRPHARWRLGLSVSPTVDAVIGRVLRVGIPLLLLVVVAGGIWMAFTGSRALAAVNDLQTAADDVQQAVGATDIPALTSAAADAQDAARRANDALDGPVWAAVAAIPYLGDAPEVARTTAAALATAAEALTPLLKVSDVLDPASLYQDGRVAVEKLRAATGPLTQAAADLTSATDTIATAPTADDGAWVPTQLDTQRAEAQTQLNDAAGALVIASRAANVMSGLLGADGPRTWFVGLQTPAEARGTGGLAGNFVVMRAEDGRLDLLVTGSNTDFRPLPELPDLGEEYIGRYGQDPRLFTNSNLSPHFPDAGALWRAFYDDSLEGDADVVMGTDVVAFGTLIDAGGPIALPDGRTLDGEAAVQFALSGVYSAYPDRDERKEFQEAVVTAVFERLTSGGADPRSLVRAVSSMISDGRLQIWSPREAEQADLEQLPTAGSLRTSMGHSVNPVVINASGSKLDAYLEREITYSVGGCPADEMASSRVSMILTNDIPTGLELDPFVVGLAEASPDGPISRLDVQFHLPMGAVVSGVTVDGGAASWFGFLEQGRPSAVVGIDLPPRHPRTVELSFSEPESSDVPTVTVQPLANDPVVSIEAEKCQT